MSLLNLVPWWARLLAVLALVSAVFGFGYLKGSEHEERAFDAYKLAEQAATLKAMQDAGAKTHAWQAQKDEALDAANKRAQANAAAAAAARHESSGLRDQLAQARSDLSHAADDAVRKYAATLTDVFGECADALTELAGKADGHAADSLTLQQSWPKP